MTIKQWIRVVAALVVITSAGTVANLLPIPNPWVKAWVISVTSGLFVAVVTALMEYWATLLRAGDRMNAKPEKDATKV